MTARLWNPINGECLLTLHGHICAVHSAIFSPDKTLALTESSDGFSKVWCSISGKCLQSYPRAAIPALPLCIFTLCPSAFSPCGSRVLLVSSPRIATMWTIETHACVKFTGHTSALTSIVFSANGNLILTASIDKTARIFSAISSTCWGRRCGHKAGLCSAAFSNNGKLVITGAEDGIAKIWCTTSLACLRTLYGHSRDRRVTTAVFSHSGKVALTASKDETVIIWSTTAKVAGTKKGICLRTLSGDAGSIEYAVLSFDSTMVPTKARCTATAMVWSVSSGVCLRDILVLPATPLFAYAFSYDCTSVITACGSVCKVWNCDDGQCALTLRGHASHVLSAVQVPAMRNRVLSRQADVHWGHQ